MNGSDPVLHHLGIGRRHAGTPVLILVATSTVTVISTTSYTISASAPMNGSDPVLHHLGIGRRHAGTPVLILVATSTVTVISTTSYT
ncbi:hypothetical protein C1S80_09590, partial [Mycolicibacterium aubagnense]